jgi:NitT/TauT family transport system substrate-binding protein
MTPHRPSRLKALAAVTLALVTGCSSAAGSASGTGRLETTTVVVDSFGAIDTAGLFIAQDKGLFRAAGLTVKLRPQFTIQPQVKDLVNGTADIASGDYVTFIQNELKGDPDLKGAKPKLRIIGEASFLQPNVLVLLVPQNARVTSVAALGSARISVLAPQNIGDLLVFSLLSDHGLPVRPVNTQHFPNVQFPQVGAAFKAGVMDAAFAPEPFVTQFEEQAGTRELADLDQGSTANFPIQGYVTTQGWAQKHPNTMRAFLRALNQGQQIADTNRAEVERVLEKFLGLPAIVADLVALPTFPIGVDATRLQRTVTAMLRFNFIGKQFSNFKVSSMIDSP